MFVLRQKQFGSNSGTSGLGGERAGIDQKHFAIETEYSSLPKETHLNSNSANSPVEEHAGID